MSQLTSDKFNDGAYNRKFSYAEYPSIKIYADSKGNAWKNHLLFGDYIKILDTDIVNMRVKARSRGCTGWVRTDQIRKDRILEVNFVDIGQGDGCHIVTPDDRHIIIDAGKTDNMNRYLTWRFNLYKARRPLPFPFTIVISHSDLDHYKGFEHVFNNDKIRVDKVYHNGLVERPGTRPLGTVTDGYITGLVKDTVSMLDLITDPSKRKGTRSTYCKTLFKALKHNPDIEFLSLAVDDGYVSGYDTTNKVHGKENSIRILGPITKKVNGKDGLKTIKNLGKDKNGHSVILKLVLDKARILLGGDVNTEFGRLIFEHYKKDDALGDLQVDVAKACHHGSNHFHYGFIQSINAGATVISSGDDESYGHPRPDAIGALGKCGYGDKPLIFSTELARSNKEITLDKLAGISELMRKIKENSDAVKIEVDPDKVKKLMVRIKADNKKINSFITKYGMINVRTDGKRMILAQKYETPSSSGKWDIHELKYSGTSKRFESQDH
jgi:beta-lactamase superfamily II metal-dependent hydrolase